MLTYYPEVFLRETERDARNIIMPTDGGLTTDERWIQETEWLLPYCQFDGLTIDYGCGIGRLAKRLTQPIIGVDISPTMRIMAETDLNRVGFATINPTMLQYQVAGGFRAAAAYTIWVLQHAILPELDVQLLADALPIGAPLVVVDSGIRNIPTMEEGQFLWLDDEKDVFAIVERAGFRETDRIPVPKRLANNGDLRRYVRV